MSLRFGEPVPVGSGEGTEAVNLFWDRFLFSLYVLLFFFSGGGGGGGGGGGLVVFFCFFVWCLFERLTLLVLSVVEIVVACCSCLFNVVFVVIFDKSHNHSPYLSFSFSFSPSLSFFFQGWVCTF